MNLRKVNEVWYDLHIQIINELYNMCIRYLESVKIKVKKEYRYISNNSYVFRFIFEERHIKDMTVLISFLRDDLIDSIRLQYSDKTNIVYYKKYKNTMDTYGYFHQNDNKSKTRKLFMSAKKFVKYINHIYHKFYNTDYYNNLQSVTTFLLICKFLKFLPKDIYLIIAKKILFFLFYFFVFNKKVKKK